MMGPACAAVTGVDTEEEGRGEGGAEGNATPTVRAVSAPALAGGAQTKARELPRVYKFPGHLGEELVDAPARLGRRLAIVRPRRLRVVDRLLARHDALPCGSSKFMKSQAEGTSAGRLEHHSQRELEADAVPPSMLQNLDPILHCCHGPQLELYVPV